MCTFIDDGECVPLNEGEPYDSEEVGMALALFEERALPVQSILLLPCKPSKPASFDELYSSIRKASGNAWMMLRTWKPSSQRCAAMIPRKRRGSHERRSRLFRAHAG